jgi:hypothetical protein
MCGRYVSPATASIEREWHIGPDQLQLVSAAMERHADDADPHPAAAPGVGRVSPPLGRKDAEHG